MPKNIMEVGRLEKELAKEREKTREAREACMELFEVAKDIARERDELRMKENLYKACELMEWREGGEEEEEVEYFILKNGLNKSMIYIII